MALRIKRPQSSVPHVAHPTAAHWHEASLATVAARLAELEAHDRFDERVPVEVVGESHTPTNRFVSILSDDAKPLIVCFETAEAQQAYLAAFASGDEATIMAIPVRLVRYSKLPYDNPFMKAARREKLTLHDGLLPSFSHFVPDRGMRVLNNEAEARDLLIVLSATTMLVERWLENNVEHVDGGIAITLAVGDLVVRASAPNPMDALVATINELNTDDVDSADENG